MLNPASTAHFAAYKNQATPKPLALWKRFAALPSYPDITFARQSAAVFSSRIEGVEIDLDFYLNSRLTNAKGIKAEIRATLEWVRALEDTYTFAETHVLNEKNLLKAHFMASAFMDNPKERGSYRRVPVVIGGRQSGIMYRATPPEDVEMAMKEFWDSTKSLLASDLAPDKALYHASMAHLVFEKIHPFTDGNGRIGRLLEKWFLARCCGSLAWKVASEAYYEQERARYYANLKALGEDYADLDFAKSVPFLLMLPEAIAAEIDEIERRH
jgi:Fic family protein